ncbi:hypothetical protein AB0M47_18725 [Hamadaea sp. NPDC051192]|uniref:hypothetical protein n=1 Tax=Hamadaea sp. NPDC051192 TaxID=3154940 RepID=UPI00343E3F97
MRTKQVLIVVTALAVVIAGGAGGWWWTHRDRGQAQTDPAPQVTGKPTKIGPDGGTVDNGEVTIVIPAGAVPSGETITVLSAEAIGAHDGEIFGRPIGVEHSQPLAKPATLRWKAGTLTARQRAAAVLTRWDPDSRMWKVAGPQLTVDGDVLTATVSEFSFWDWAASASQWTGQIAGKRVDAPHCNGKPLPGWVRGVVDPDEDLSAAALRVCFEPDRDDIVTARVANNRSFTQRLTLTPKDAAWAWTWAGREEFGPKAVIYRTAHDVFDTDTSYLLPPTHEVAVGIGRPAGAGSQLQTATGVVDFRTVLTDAVAYVFDQIPVGGSDNPLINALLQALFECGGKQALDRPERKVDAIVRAVVHAVTDCAAEIVRPDSEFGARLESLEQQIIRGNPGATAQTIARGDRMIHQLAQACKILAYADLLFYLSDQLAETLVGPLMFSVRGDGKPQKLGEWKPSCTDRDTDSNRLYRNLALQDTFADKNKELWQFSQWRSSARTAIQPMKTCPAEYLLKFADYLPGDWGDPKAARVVADEIRRLAGYAAVPSGDQLRRLGACSAACTVTGQVWFDHPAWGHSLLFTTLPKEVGVGEAYITVIDGAGKVRWQHRAGYWYRLAPNSPARDNTGHIFLNYDPGRLNGVIILNPSPAGFDTYQTLPAPGDYAQRFYSASVVDTNHDGRFEIDSALNDCEPDCAGGTIHHTSYQWNGSDYIGH